MFGANFWRVMGVVLIDSFTITSFKVMNNKNSLLPFEFLDEDDSAEGSSFATFERDDLVKGRFSPGIEVLATPLLPFER